MNAHALNDSNFKFRGIIPCTECFQEIFKKTLRYGMQQKGLVGPAHTTHPTPYIRAQSVPVNPVIIMLSNNKGGEYCRLCHDTA